MRNLVEASEKEKGQVRRDRSLVSIQTKRFFDQVFGEFFESA